MQLSNAPGKLLLPFAYAGGRNAIPVDSQILTSPGAASLTDGFPPLTRTPIVAGGVPPSGLDMNGILFELSALARWYNAGGGFTYDATFAGDTNVGGYPAGARVMRSDKKGYWLNTVDGNSVDPESMTVGQAVIAGWVPDTTVGIANIALASSNVTLTPAQYGMPVIVLSGTLTANLNLNFPDSMVGEWTVDNNCTGNFTVNCKTASGGGVVLSPGESRRLFSDGSNLQAADTGGGAGSYKTGFQLRSNTTLDAQAIGNVYQVAANSIAITLPLLSTTKKGSAITFVNNGSTGVTIGIQSTNRIIIGNQGNLTSIPLNVGDSVTLTNVDGGNWFATAGSAVTPYLNYFLNNLGAQGYQKLPGGLVIQWGELGSPGTSGTLTFPTAFPNGCLSIATTMNGTVPITSTLAFNLTAGLTTGVGYTQSANVAFSYIALGY